MGVERRDKNDRITAGAPPKIKVRRGEDGELDLSPEGRPEGVHPETIAEERPTQPDDPRPAYWQNAGGPWVG